MQPRGVMMVPRDIHVRVPSFAEAWTEEVLAAVGRTMTWRERMLFGRDNGYQRPSVLDHDHNGMTRRGVEEKRSQRLTSCLASLAAQPAQLRC